MNKRPRQAFRVAAWITGVAAGAAPAVQGGLADPTPLGAAIHARVEKVFEGLAAGGDLGTAHEELASAFDMAIAYAEPADVEPIREAAAAMRLYGLFENSEPGSAARQLGVLRANPDLAGCLAFLVSPQDDPEGVLTLLDRIHESRPDAMKKYPALCAAILVVYDVPVTRRVNMPEVAPGGQAPPPPPMVDPIAVLDHFTVNAKKMVFDPAKLPAELAVFMVGMEVSPEDAAWALDKYHGDNQIGRHYDDVPYDTQYYERGVAKRIDSVEYTLPNVLRVGGICVDQAFFAESIAKACGVPAVTVSGTRGEIGHAWAGYLQRQGAKAKWNFDEGRYDEFDDVRASADDPQTDGQITTADLALLAESVRTPADQRQRAEAMCDAAARLMDLMDLGGDGYPPAREGAAGSTSARAANIEEVLELYRGALDLCPCLRDAWEGVTGMAAAGRLNAGQRKAWAEAADQFCAQDYPDFAARVLRAMIAGIPDTGEQSGLWDWAMKRFARRPDLAAEMALAKARMWEGAKEKAKAYDEYVRIVDQFGNRTPLAPVALYGAERLLAGEHDDEVLPLYAASWKKIKKPASASPQAWSATNWYIIGEAYARKLESAGKTTQAEQVRRQLDPAGLRKKK